VPPCGISEGLLRFRVVQTGSTSAWVRANRLIGFGLALALATLMSGASELAVLALSGDDCCESECDGSFEDDGCSPSCTQGQCAKSLVTLSERAIHELRAAASGDVSISVSEPTLSPVPSGVFHPPRV
jgi:hypothetical protein